MPDPRWRRYLRFFGPDVRADVADELRFHLDERIAEYERRGLSRAEAERAARERMGDLDGVRDDLEHHDRARLRVRTWSDTMDRLRQDFRLALRGFRRTPGFFATAVVILAVGIGMSVAMFTVFRTVLLRRLPVADQDHVVAMWTYRDNPNADYALGTKQLSVVRRESRTMRDIAAVAHWPATPSPLRDGERSVELNRGMVTGNFFDVLGVRPALGRLMRASDDEPPDAKPTDSTIERAVVLSYRAWHEKFGGDSTVVGRRLVEPYYGTPYTVIGVAPPGFDYPAGAEYWMPMWNGWQSEVSAFAVARLRPGASVASARDEYLAIERRLSPEADFRGAHAATFGDTVVGNVRPELALLTAAVLLLLLIACLNVGNLLLLRASGRRGEIGVRRALGAGFGDIVRQLLVEALMIATAGGVLGFGLADVLLRLLVAHPPASLPRVDDLRLAGAPVAAAVAVCTAAVVLFGLVPAVVGARSGAPSPMRADSRTGRETRRRHALRQTLVAAQVALAMVMLGGAALLARSLAQLVGQDLGFDSDRLTIVDYTWDAHRDSSTAQLAALGDRIEKRIRAVPGVTAATRIVAPPLLGNGIWLTKLARDGDTDAEATKNPSFPLELCGPEYFATFRTPIVRGRAFTDGDRPGAPLVAIVSEQVAARLWPDQDPIGKRVRMPGQKPEYIVGGDGWRTVVGVARETHLRTIRESSPTVYFPAAQSYWQGSIAVRSAMPFSQLVAALRRAGTDVGPDVRLWSPQRMDDVLAQPLAQPRLGALLMSSFGIVALLLAAIGLYGVMASQVRDQTRELGIRIALGATPARVRRAVLARAAIVTGAGAIVGVAAALGASRLLTSLLFRVKPTDPIALGGACVVLLGVAALAAYVPARRATRIDPAQALRAE